MVSPPINVRFKRVVLSYTVFKTGTVLAAVAPCLLLAYYQTHCILICCLLLGSLAARCLVPCYLALVRLYITSLTIYFVVLVDMTQT